MTNYRNLSFFIQIFPPSLLLLHTHSNLHPSSWLSHPRHSEPVSATKAPCSPSLDQESWHLFLCDLWTKNYFYIFKMIEENLRKTISWHMNIIWNSNFSVHEILLENCHTYVLSGCFCQNLSSCNKNLQSLKADHVLHRKFAYPCLALHSTLFLCLKHFFRIRLGASLLYSILYLALVKRFVGSQAHWRLGTPGLSTIMFLKCLAHNGPRIGECFP